MLAGHLKHGAAIAVIVLCVLVFLAAALALGGLTAVVPGQARVVQLFGKYRGTIRELRLAVGEPVPPEDRGLHPDP